MPETNAFAIVSTLEIGEGIRHKHFKEINWLPITDRVDQFIAVSAYKFSKGLAPKSRILYNMPTARESFFDDSLICSFRKLSVEN